jgi:hypothetical protein
MTGAEQISALLADTGLTVTRQWISEKCRRLGIPRRGKLGPRRVKTDEERKADSRARFKDWYDDLKQDSQRFAEYNRRHRRREAAAV